MQISGYYKINNLYLSVYFIMFINVYIYGGPIVGHCWINNVGVY